MCTPLCPYFYYLISLLYRQMPPKQNRNRSSSWEIKRRIARIEVDHTWFIKFDFATGSQEIKIAIRVKFGLF